MLGHADDMGDPADQEDRRDDRDTDMMGIGQFQYGEQDQEDRRMFGQVGVDAPGGEQIGIVAVAKSDLAGDADLDRGIGAIDQQQRTNRGGEAGYR